MKSSSLKSRYIIFSTLLFILIIAVLSWTTHSVQNNSSKSLENVDGRMLLQLASSLIRDGVWETDFNLNAYLLTPTSENREKLLLSLYDLANNIETLSSNEWSQLQDRKLLLSQLDKNIISMHQNIKALIDIREDQEKRFPSLSIIHDKLYPANLEFITMTSLALEEMPTTHLTSEEAEFYRLLADTQSLWHRLIGSFRLFVAYRSETISNPTQGMSNELNNIDTLFSAVMDNLRDLDKLNRANYSEIQPEESIDEMVYIAENWYDNYRIVSEVHTSDQWRKDDSIIRERLQPLSQDTRELLYRLDKEINKSIQMEVHSLTHLAESVIKQIWFLGTIILVFLLGGYFYLRNRVLQPISNVADALMSQSQEARKVRLPVTNARELNTLVSAFNHLSDSLAHAEAVVRHTDKMSTVGELASCVAHEINNPLNNMVRVTEFIEEELKTDDISETVGDDFKILHREINRCANIVKNLLDFGKPNDPKITVVSLTPILDESIQLLKHKAQDKNLKLETNTSPGLPDVNADPSQIHQVFVNLILNAIEFSPSDETITISLKQENPDYVICYVIDHGVGANDAAIEHFFDPFYTTRKGHEGMGLGLSVCHGIIKHHQGDIGVKAGEYNGLIVWFTLPIANTTETDE